MKNCKCMFLILFFVFKLHAQKTEFNKSINQDSLFNVVIKRVPENNRNNIRENYKKANEQEKVFLLFILSMPQSSKKELIANLESKKYEIESLREEYTKFVPENYFVYVEFEPENILISKPETVTIKIKIYKSDVDTALVPSSDSIQFGPDIKIVSQNWDLKYGSEELATVLKNLSWTNETLNEIKKLLVKANCISVQNGEPTKIGFSRNGMGMYSYRIFKKNLTKNEVEQYNDGCSLIYYKDNFVLEYGGGAIGLQCFERE